MARCTLAPSGDGLALASPYDPAFVAAFKAAVPPNMRRWDGASRRWLISPAQAKAVADLCETFFMERPHVPQAQAALAAPQIRVFKLEYLGACKERDDRSVSAYGYCDGSWSVIAPEAVLRAWFDGAPAEAGRPAAPPTYYAVLGIQPDATPEQIRAGYKRMARQWHPDVCKEPDAHERFLVVRDAYNILSDTQLRRKYDVGRLFEQRAASQEQQRRPYVRPDYFRAPLRCGMVLAEAAPSLGRWTLTKILAWDDITDLAGRTMVASWDSDNERIRVEWSI